MRIIWLGLGMVVLAAYGGYVYGKSKAQIRIVEKEAEVIKHVAQKRAKIQAEPNASRNDLLELMHAGKL